MTFLDNPVVYSFCLYVMYLLLPLVPAAAIFKMFPQTKVAVSGPLQHLSFRASGAFGAYVVTAALGYTLVMYVERQIDSMRHPVYYGVFVDLAPNQAVQSDRMLWNCTSAVNDMPGWRNCAFAVPLDGPAENADPVLIRYYELGANEGSGVGVKAPTELLSFALVASRSYPPRYRIRKENNRWIVGPESDVSRASTVARN